MSEMKKSQKGIHQPDYSTTYYKDGKVQDGISRAGIKTREAASPSSFEEYDESPKAAKAIHEKVLGEMKQMPKPNLPKSEDGMEKDDMPHKAGSPEDSAHDVAEEGSSLQKEMADLTPEEQAEMLAHLRMLKDKRELRSPENQAVGADENPMNPEMEKGAPHPNVDMKGVHKPVSDMTLREIKHGGKHLLDHTGRSSMGTAARSGYISAAKSHSILSEMKQMPKPNLPKSEEGMGKSEYSAAQVAMEILKKTESMYKAKAQLWDDQKTDKRIEDLPMAQTREVLNENDIANAVSQKLTDTSVQRLKSYLESRKAKKGVK